MITNSAMVVTIVIQRKAAFPSGRWTMIHVARRKLVMPDPIEPSVLALSNIAGRGCRAKKISHQCGWNEIYDFNRFIFANLH